MVHFEKYLKVCEAISNDEGISNAKRNIALTRSKYEDGNNNEELMKASQKLYELRVAEHGEGNLLTIEAGREYVICLHKANRPDEARELLTMFIATSKQVLGPHHNKTKDIESTLQRANR